VQYLGSLNRTQFPAGGACVAFARKLLCPVRDPCQGSSATDLPAADGPFPMQRLHHVPPNRCNHNLWSCRVRGHPQPYIFPEAGDLPAALRMYKSRAKKRAGASGSDSRHRLSGAAAASVHAAPDARLPVVHHLSGCGTLACRCRMLLSARVRRPLITSLSIEVQRFA
jgi:hypothetical protein